MTMSYQSSDRPGQGGGQRHSCEPPLGPIHTDATKVGSVAREADSRQARRRGMAR
jgi:hypothetical protein